MATVLIKKGDWLKITRPPKSEGGDGSIIYVRIEGTNIGTSTNPNNTASTVRSDTIDLDVFNNLIQKNTLDWHNCYSFGNGVESNRVGDTFNSMKIVPGVRVSTQFEDYKEEHRKYGLIYSGIYNDNSGVNNLNQFVQAEKITKDINPTYGSIQKLHARDTDLITLCEDKVLKIMANKDAVYNADGNIQLTATSNVLGQTIPFVGEYGISKNPESFVSEAYRSYFTDKQRGAVLRLSRDGLTPISEHGMKDWFRDNLSTGEVNLLSEDNLESENYWDIPSNGNVKFEDGYAVIGYYNNDIHDQRYGRRSDLIKEDILEVGKKYRLQFDILKFEGPDAEGSTWGPPSIFIRNNPIGTSTHEPIRTNQHRDNSTVNITWTARRPHLEIIQFQINSRHDFDVDNSGSIDPATETELPGYYQPPGGVVQSVRDWVNSERIAAGAADANSDGIPDGNDYGWANWLYANTVYITNLRLTEVKAEPKIIGSYDDRQDEYNLSIGGGTWKTLSFREDVKGWVSFKSFMPENALSCANDYYTIKDGLLYQHHVQGANNNTFYGKYTNSSLDVILNQQPSSVKSFHSLDYEGSDSRVEGIRTVEVTGIEHAGGASHDGRYFFYEKEDMSKVIGNHDLDSWHGTVVNMKQYRNHILVNSGTMKIFNDPTGNSGLASPSGGPTKGHGRYEPYSSSNPGDWQVGDIITTEQQEKTVNHFNSMSKDGWWVSRIETNKQKGSLTEFIEREGKWFNYIKGTDEDNINAILDGYGGVFPQGVGIVDSVDGNDISFANSINYSLQVGDTLYSERPSEVLSGELIDFNAANAVATGFTITNNTTVEWDSGNATGTGNSHPTYYLSNPSEIDFIEGERYRLTLIISNYTGTNPVGISHSAGVSGSARRTSNGRYTEDFISDGETPDIFARFTNSATIQVSIKRILSGNVFGFSRLEANNIQKVGVVTSLTNNIITVDNSGVIPSVQDYVLFVKNQVVNTGGLKGYYANVKFENNSKRKAEIFSVSSEVSESSK